MSNINKGKIQRTPEQIQTTRDVLQGLSEAWKWCGKQIPHGSTALERAIKHAAELKVSKLIFQFSLGGFRFFMKVFFHRLRMKPRGTKILKQRTLGNRGYGKWFSTLISNHYD